MRARASRARARFFGQCSLQSSDLCIDFCMIMDALSCLFVLFELVR